MSRELAGSALLAFVLTLVVIPPLLRLLARLGSVDVPNHRSSHVGTVLRGAGLAIGLGFTVALVLRDDAGPLRIPIATIALLMTCLGFADDLRDLPVRVRLALLIIAGGFLGFAISPILHPVVSCALSALWIASTVNAYNFMDGINGISALTAMVAGVCFVVLGLAINLPLLSGIGACVFGAAAAFLPFNAPHARAFMGDAGSYGLGFITGAASWIAWANGVPLWVALAPLSIYLIDTASTLALRALRREPLSSAHREHMYQRLVQSGWGHVQASMLVVVGAAIVFAITYASWQAGSAVMGLSAWLGAILAYSFGTRVLITKRLSSSQTP